MIDSLLSLDLNVLVSEHVREVMNNHSTQAEEMQTRLSQNKLEINNLREELTHKNKADNLSNMIINKYMNLNTREDKYWYVYDIMSFLGVKPSNSLDFNNKYRLDTFLSYIYYDNQDILRCVLEALGFDSNMIFIKLGRDFNDSHIKKILHKPAYTHSNYSVGVINFDSPSEYTYDEVFKNKHILEEENLSLILDTITHTRGNFTIFLFLDKYTNLTNEYINKLYECFSKYTSQGKPDYDKHYNDFIYRNLNKLNIEHQRHLINVHGINTHKCCVVNYLNVHHDLLIEHLNKLDVNQAISNMRLYGWSFSMITKYITKERALDIDKIIEPYYNI